MRVDSDIRSFDLWVEGVWEYVGFGVEIVDCCDERLVRSVVTRHRSGRMGMSCEALIARKVCSSESVNTLFGIPNHNEGDGFVIAKKRLEYRNLQRIAVLALVDDRCA